MMHVLKKLIVANWKSNKSVSEAKNWVNTFSQQKRRDNYEYVVCPPYPSLPIVKAQQADLYSIGVQDLSAYGAGAYTGEVSAVNLTGLNVQYAILGHSERRRYLNETSALVAKKIESALEENITPIVCIDRDQFQTQADQIDKNLYGKIIIAYEPVHAISTFGGHEDPIEVTLEAIQEIRDIFGAVPVLYGGSVDPSDSLVYLGEDAIDGVLVGGASLDPKKFAQL